MKIDNFLDKEIGRQLMEANREERANHKSSGKLSAGALGSPLQWQILKYFKIPEAPKDEYTLRKFKRGKDIEKWYLDAIPNVQERNFFVEYRGVVGYIDAIVKTEGWDFPIGTAPLEVKSVSNAKFKRITKQLGPDRSHCLQGSLYALAMGVDEFPISYIASDDYRVQTYIVSAEERREEIDLIIDRYNLWVARNAVPVFEPEEQWQANPKYNNYPEWSELTGVEIAEKLKEERLKSAQLALIK